MQELFIKFLFAIAMFSVNVLNFNRTDSQLELQSIIKEEKISYVGTVESIDVFGSVILDISSEDFMALGFVLGDSVDIKCSGGFEIDDIPIYDNYYGLPYDSIVTNYLDNISLAGISCDYASYAGITENETVTITLNTKGEYKELQEMYFLPDPRVRMSWQTDAQFSNARMVTVGNIKENRFYRGSTPLDPHYDRIELISDYLEEKNINTVINLADNNNAINKYTNITTTVQKLLDNSSIHFEKMGVAYDSDDTKDKIGNILTDITEGSAPYYVHCSLGQDRTGFVCCILEAFCGASYDEIIDDYMLSYDNLYGITKETDPERYNLMKKRIDYMFTLITGQKNASKMSTKEIGEATWKYLRQAGVSEQTLQDAYSKLCE